MFKEKLLYKKLRKNTRFSLILENAIVQGSWPVQPRTAKTDWLTPIHRAMVLKSTVYTYQKLTQKGAYFVEVSVYEWTRVEEEMGKIGTNVMECMSDGRRIYCVFQGWDCFLDLSCFLLSHRKCYLPAGINHQETWERHELTMIPWRGLYLLR